jgi:raffinose/stachyose/melibiose transport system permease protein
MTRPRLSSKNIGKVVLGAFLIVLAFLQLFPLIWVFNYSLQKTGDLFGSAFFSLPAVPQWNNYVRAFIDGKILQSSINSVFIVVTSVAATTVLAFCIAYACTRMSWKLRKVVLGFVSLGMVIPIHVTLLPNFIWFGMFGLLDTHLSLIIPYVAFQISFSTLVIAAQLQSVPLAMEESAFMDGAKYRSILPKIIAPMATPAIVTAMISTFLSDWNEFIMANTYLATDAKRTLPFSIIRFQGQYASDYAVQFACMVLVAIPALIIFFLFSKWIMAGVSAGAVKG